MASDERARELDCRQAAKRPLPSRVVPRPITRAQLEDPREYQLRQIRRRYGPKESQQGGLTLLTFKLKPSDPDFPFELTTLECNLKIPAEYPTTKPELSVGNKDIPRGIAINIEIGFAELAAKIPQPTLLELVKALDRHLEAFLSQQKAENIKSLPTKDDRHLYLASKILHAPNVQVYPKVANSGANLENEESRNHQVDSRKLGDIFTQIQREDAIKRRGTEIRQLEARMSRLSLFEKSRDGIAYTLPFEPRKRSDLPASLQAINAVRLFVPLLYPLQPCRVRFEGLAAQDVAAVEKGFELRAKKYRDMTLMSHVNFLAQNMLSLAKTSLEPSKAAIEDPEIPKTDVELAPRLEKGKAVVVPEDLVKSFAPSSDRPPEWTMVNANDIGEDESDVDIDSYDTESSEDPGNVGEIQVLDANQGTSTRNTERGTSISFPSIELYGIETLELVTLNLTVKCGRCREVNEVKGLKAGMPKSESCKKCATPLSITYSQDLVHANSVRAGFLDLEGCTIVDMLPSTFIPTCCTCSTAFPRPGITTIRAEATTNICRTCHSKLTFVIPTIKFLRITSSTIPPTSGPRRKKEVLGLTPGTELPKRGRCRHYTKSYRWFRFGCCGKVYACDRCHDEVEEHANEWAKRMICGWCSREGNYRPSDCAFCHGVLVGRSGGGFWEGGKGTRDRVRMSRKDKRKYRRM